MNVVLIGLPGSGKSSVGVLLAKQLGYGFVDTDITIQNNEGELLQSIIDTKGIKHFLACEERALLETNGDRLVIAPGGSCVYSEAGMEHLKQNALCVYLELRFAKMRRRLIDIKTRGVVLKPGESLQQMYTERLPLYEKYADVTLNCSRSGVSLTAEQLVAEITELVQNKDN